MALNVAPVAHWLWQNLCKALEILKASDSSAAGRVLTPCNCCVHEQPERESAKQRAQPQG